MRRCRILNRILEDGRNRQYYRASACSGERRFPNKSSNSCFGPPRLGVLTDSICGNALHTLPAAGYRISLDHLAHRFKPRVATGNWVAQEIRFV